MHIKTIRKINNKENASFHLRNSETLSNQHNRSGGTPNEDTLRSAVDLNNIGNGVSEYIQDTVRNIDRQMDNDLEEIQNTY